MHKGGPPGSEPCHLQAEDKARLAKRNITSSKLLSVNPATNRRCFRKIFMLNHLAGKAVVITGASSGIGQATAEAFARAGASIVLAARGTDALEAVAQKCRGLGSPNAIAVTTDVTDAEAVRELVARGSIPDWCRRYLGQQCRCRCRRSLPRNTNGSARAGHPRQPYRTHE
jgi:FlaA1/EpsC-like NDP-sugar epimerase